MNLPEALLNSVKKGGCVLFVGSGLSVAAGYRSWSQLIEKLVDEAKKIPQARTGGLKKYVDANDFLTLAEFARSTLGTNRYGALLKDMLATPVAVPAVHDIIAATKYRGIITTNYDKLLETAFTIKRGWAPSVFTSEAASSMARALYADNAFIFKLHGDIESAPSLVLTEFDYDRMILQNPHARVFLQSVFLNHTVLFVGYGLQDPDLRLALKELVLIFQGYTPTHYALVANAGDLEIKHLMQRMNIQAIPYTPTDGHQQAVEILAQLQAIAPFTSPQSPP